MDAISIDKGALKARASRFSVRLAVAVGESAEEAQPWGIVSDVSAGGMYIRTNKRPPARRDLRLWFVSGRSLRPVDARVVRQDPGGVGVRFEDSSFYYWAFERTTNC